MNLQPNKIFKAVEKGATTGKEVSKQVEQTLGVELDLVQTLGIMSASSASHSVAEMFSPEEQEALAEWLDS